jgi:hypothetical protein
MLFVIATVDNGDSVRQEEEVFGGGGGCFFGSVLVACLIFLPCTPLMLIALVLIMLCSVSYPCFSSSMLTLYLEPP